jgi:hypothetical protein
VNERHREFSTAAILGAITGYCLEEKGFGPVAKVFDHFWPGIMDTGMVVTQKAIVAVILDQHPRLREVLRTAPGVDVAGENDKAKFVVTDADALVNYATMCVGPSLMLGPAAWETRGQRLAQVDIAELHKQEEPAGVRSFDWGA